MVQRIELNGTVHEFPDEFTQADISAALQRAAQPQQPEGLGQQVVRQIGLTGRAIGQGVMQLPNMLADAGAGAINLGIRGVNSLAGTNVPEMGRPSAQTDYLLNQVTPQPRTPTENVVNRVGRGTVSLATGMLGAGAAAPLNATTRVVADAITANPGSQLSAVLGMETGGGVTHEMYPDSPTAELIGSIVGGVGGLGAYELGRYGINLARALAAPVTRSGQERIVGDAITRMAQDPMSLQSRLSSGQREFVPGSARTTAEVSGDPGLMQAERGVRSMGTRESGQFALRDALRNQARGAAMEDMAPRMDQASAGDTVRTQLGRALGNSRADVSRAYGVVSPDAGELSGPTIWDRVAPTINELYGRATNGTPQELLPVLERLRNSPNLSVGDVRAMIRETGNMAGQAQVRNDATLASAAGSIRSALQNHLDEVAMSGAPGLTTTDTTALRLGAALRRNQGAAYEHGAVGRVLDTDQFGRPNMPSENVPRTLMGGPTAIRQYEAAIGADPAARSAMQGAFVDMLRNAVQTTAPDAQGAFMDSAAKFHNFLRDNRQQAQILFGADGVRNLENIARDFASRQMVDTVGRAIGSNTVQNLSTAHIIGAVTGGMVNPTSLETNPMLAPLRFLYRAAGSETALRELLTDAMLNPDLAARLVARATPENIERAASLLQTTMAQRAAEVGRGITQPAFPAAIAGASRPREMRQERTP